jgi:hypothetical protein
LKLRKKERLSSERLPSTTRFLEQGERFTPSSLFSQIPTLAPSRPKAQVVASEVNFLLGALTGVEIPATTFALKGRERDATVVSRREEKGVGGEGEGWETGNDDEKRKNQFRRVQRFQRWWLSLLLRGKLNSTGQLAGRGDVGTGRKLSRIGKERRTAEKTRALSTILTHSRSCSQGEHRDEGGKHRRRWASCLLPAGGSWWAGAASEVPDSEKF